MDAGRSYEILPGIEYSSSVSDFGINRSDFGAFHQERHQSDAESDDDIKHQQHDAFGVGRPASASTCNFICKDAEQLISSKENLDRGRPKTSHARMAKVGESGEHFIHNSRQATKEVPRTTTGKPHLEEQGPCLMKEKLTSECPPEQDSYEEAFPPLKSESALIVEAAKSDAPNETFEQPFYFVPSNKALSKAYIYSNYNCTKQNTECLLVSKLNVPKSKRSVSSYPLRRVNSKAEPSKSSVEFMVRPVSSTLHSNTVATIDASEIVWPAASRKANSAKSSQALAKLRSPTGLPSSSLSSFEINRRRGEVCPRWAQRQPLKLKHASVMSFYENSPYKDRVAQSQSGEYIGMNLRRGRSAVSASQRQRTLKQLRLLASASTSGKLSQTPLYMLCNLQS